MTISELYIGETLLDLYPNEIAVTVNGYDFNDPTKRKVDFTSSFRLPASENNIEALGYANEITSDSVKPYRKLSCQYVISGIQQLQSGILIINSFNKDFNVNIYDSQIDLFDELESRKLYELDYLTNGPYKLANIDAFRLSTSGIVSPVIDWGVATSGSIQPDYYLPTWFYYELVMKSLEFTGLELEGDIFESTDLTDLVVPFSLDEWVYPEYVREQYFFSAKNSVSTVTSVSTKISISNVLAQGSLNLYDSSGSQLEMPHLGATGNYVTYHFKAAIRYTSVGSSGNSFYFRLICLRSSVEITIAEKLESMVAPGGGGEFTLESDFNLQDDDVVYVKYFTNSGTPTVTVTDAFFQGTNTGKIHDNYVFFNYLLPDITMKEIVDDFTYRFGVIYRQDGNKLICKTLQEVLNDKQNALDWTDKRAKGSDPIEFQLNYAQSNTFEYAQGVDDMPDLGKGYIEVDNEILEPESSIYESPFETSELNTLLFINMGRIPVYGSLHETKVFNQVNNSGGFVQLQFNGVDLTEYFVRGKVVKFISTNLVYNNVYGEITSVSFSTNTLVTLDQSYVSAAPGGDAKIVDRGDFQNASSLKLMTLRERLSNEQSVIFNVSGRNDYRVAFFDDTAYSAKTTGMQYFVDAYYGGFSVSIQKAKFVQRDYYLDQDDVYHYNPHRLIYHEPNFFIINKISNFVPGLLSKVNQLRVF